MKKLKCWKRDGKMHSWQNKKINREVHIHINVNEPYKGQQGVTIRTMPNKDGIGTILKEREFGSSLSKNAEENSLRFAQKYMEEHNTC